VAVAQAVASFPATVWRLLLPSAQTLRRKGLIFSVGEDFFSRGRNNFFPWEKFDAPTGKIRLPEERVFVVRAQVSRRRLTRGASLL
jgi:hypothetical protein